MRAKLTALRTVAGKMPALPGAAARHRINDRREFLRSLWRVGCRKNPFDIDLFISELHWFLRDDDYDNDNDNDRDIGFIRWQVQDARSEPAAA